MSVDISSELARHHANLADVAASPANQYGLAHGYAIMPDPNDTYGWQAFEEERARQKCLASLAQNQSLYTLSTSSTTAATTTTRSTRSCSSSSSSCEESDDEDSDDADDCDCDCDKKKKKKKCGGAWCRRRSLSFQRSSPHWCDGKKWGGKIWGLSRAPGDKCMSNWHMYFDPKVSKYEIKAICRRRCPPEPRRRSYHTIHSRSRRRHRRVTTKIVVCGACQGIGCMQCQSGGVFVPVNYDYTGDAGYGVGYGSNYTGSGGYGHYGAGGLPNMPPHPGYSGHPAGNMEHWRVRSDKDSKKKDKDKDKDGSNDGSNESSKKGSEKGSKKGSKDGSKDGSTVDGNTMGELAGRMQTMRRNEKGFWGGKWEKAADDMPKVTVADLRVLEKGYQPQDKDGKGAGDDAAKWLWGRFGNVRGAGGGGGGEGGGGGVFYGGGGRGGSSRLTGGGGPGGGGGGGGGGTPGYGGTGGGGGGGGDQGNSAKGAAGGSGGRSAETNGGEGSGSGENGNEGGSRKSKSASGNGSGNGGGGGGGTGSATAARKADNVGEGPSSGSKRDGQSASGHASQSSQESKVKGKEAASEWGGAGGDGDVAAARASGGAVSQYSPCRRSQSQQAPSQRAPSQHSSPPQAMVAAVEEDERQSRFERLRQRLGDAGRLRTGSWERVSPAMQREREWHRQQAMKEEWQKMQAEKHEDHRSSSGSACNSPLLREEDEHEKALLDQLLISEEGSSSRNNGPRSPAEFVARFDGAQYPVHPEHLANLARRRAVSDTVSYVSLGSTTTASAPTRPAQAQSIHRVHSTSGDTGYETGHETGEANAAVYAGRFDDPGYGSLYDIPGYADYVGYAGWGTACADNAAWDGVSSSSTTLQPSSARSSSSKSKYDEKGVRRQTEKRKDEAKDKKIGKDKDHTKKGKKKEMEKKKKEGKSEASSSWTTCSSSRGSHSHQHAKRSKSKKDKDSETW